MKVQDGWVVLPSGMRYRLLVLPSYNADNRPVMHVEGNYVYTAGRLPKVQTMTPQLLNRIKELVAAGATVLGTRPLKSPSLAGYPRCDAALKRLADEIWGENAGSEGIGEHRLGKGRVIWGSTPEKVLSGMNVPADFSCDNSLKGKLRYTHRRTEDGTDIYFVANKVDGVVQGVCNFRSTGQPELWHPQTGRRECLAMYERKNAVTRVPLRFDPHESVFVVFPPGRNAFDPVVSVTREGRNALSVTPDPTKIVISKASYGVPGDPARSRDVTAKVQAIVDDGERRFAAWRLGEGDDPAPQALKTLSVDSTIDGIPRHDAVLDGETLCLGDVIDPTPAVQIRKTGEGNAVMEAWQNGDYELKTASGKTSRRKVVGIPAPMTVDGPWELHFPAKSGVPENVTFDRLISWSDHIDSNVKYFSGTAVYRKSFRLPPAALASGRAIYLDLGKVAVIAEVCVNGRDLGILWNSPFRVEATEALKAGDNLLEIRVTNLLVNRLIGDEQLPEDSATQSRRFAQVLARLAVVGQAEPNRPANVCHIPGMEKRLALAEIRPPWSGESLFHAKGGSGVPMILPTNDASVP